MLACVEAVDDAVGGLAVGPRAGVVVAPDGEDEPLHPDGGIGPPHDRLGPPDGVDGHGRAEDAVRFAQGAQGPYGEELRVAGADPDADECARHSQSPALAWCVCRLRALAPGSPRSQWRPHRTHTGFPLLAAVATVLTKRSAMSGLVARCRWR